MTAQKKVRVRIAPSPTGFLHIGTARTALFNWLFAKKLGGVFILRIEDTDKERSEAKYEKSIIEGLAWLGLTWDEGPVRQSERGDMYESAINTLLKENHAYRCFCTEDELESSRQDMLSRGVAPTYAGTCANLSQKIVEARLKKGDSSVIRFRMPERSITVNDLIRGSSHFDMALVGDITIAKSPREPLYNFAAVIDDHEMNISHVIRGEDHFANTPKQIAIGEALGFPIPAFAHLPLILNADRSKMSKRESATSLEEYKSAGYLPEAIVNFLSLLGWHPLPEVDRVTGKVIEREILTLSEITERFELDRVQKGGAVFSLEKLDWLNAHYLKKLSDEEFIDRATEAGFTPKKASKKELLAVIHLIRDRVKKLSDIPDLTDFFFEMPSYDAALLLWKQIPKAAIKANLESSRAALESVKTFSKESLTEALTPLTNERGRGEVLWPLRTALSGRDASPGPFEMMEVLGKKETLSRIDAAVAKLTKSA